MPRLFSSCHFVFSLLLYHFVFSPKLIEDIDEYDGDNPLFPWIKVLVSVGDIQAVREKFWHSDRYKDDLRYLKVWLENSYEEYVEIHSRCMRQLGLPVSDSTITCLQVKQMMGKRMMMVLHVGPGNHLGQQTHGFWAKSGLCSNTLNNCFNQEVGDEKSILELEFLI
ncbi:hypothetical protein DY000_02011657 [Brassica cretica]|uniref:BUB1 N-terminal domain-containing protein n=1 Tax=Brassica cretica TaxID=69181 RepID=A0ABQ7CWI7_BRACR|nr:hypothetical protein DY000_02011657 [Brassica cretica]